MQSMISETVNGVDKLKRYGWAAIDEPGTQMTIHKDDLQIHPAYQRDVIPSKVKDITANWSWVGAGAIVVGERGGEFWVIDGQHRVLAAKRRSDITHLPCVVFLTKSVKQEAKAFLILNTGRKPVSSIGKFNAMLYSGDKTALIVHEALEELGVTLKSTASKGKELKSVAWALQYAGKDADKFVLVMRTAAELCYDMPIYEKLLDGLWYINEHMDGGIADKRFRERLRQVGAPRLIEAAGKAAAYFSHGGARVWAEGMLDVINKGLRTKFVMRVNDRI